MRALAAYLFLAGVVSAQTPPPPQAGTIRGVVKDSAGDPVPGVLVNIVRLDFGLRIVSMPNGTSAALAPPPTSSDTDEAGSYALSGLPPGSYSVSVNFGHNIPSSFSRRIKLDADQELTLDIVVPANPTISGHVLYQNKEPVVDAFVWLLKPDLLTGSLKQVVIGPKVTGEDGAYTFDIGLEPNRRYFVLVDRPPPDELVPSAAADLKDRERIEVPTYYPSTTRMESASPVVLQPGERREQVDIKLAAESFYCVEGKIQTAGAPWSSDYAIQEAPLAGSRLARVRGYAGSDGSYHACGLSPGLYRLTTQDSFTEFTVSNSDLHHVDLSMDLAHVRLHVDWDGDPPPSAVQEFDAAGQAALRKLAELMGMGSNISDDDLKKLVNRLTNPKDEEMMGLLMLQAQNDQAGMREFARVIGQQLRPAGLVSVGLASAVNSLGPSLSGRVPFEGPFAAGIPAGDYTVEVQDRSNDLYAKEVTYNDLKPAEGILRIAPATTGTLHVLMSAGAAKLTVKVADSEGQPVRDATVLVLPDSVSSVTSLSRLRTRGQIDQTDQNGSFTSRSLPPGKYRVLAITQQIRWGVPEDVEKVVLVLFQARDVELAPKASLQITVAPVPI